MVSSAFDKELAAARAECALQITHPSGQIARIDETKPRATANLSCSNEIFRSCVIRVRHLVVFVKRGHVPGNIQRDARYKFRQAFQFLLRIVESGYEQGHDLHPKAHLVESPDRVEHRLQAPPKLAIATVIETLEIDFKEIHPRP